MAQIIGLVMVVLFLGGICAIIQQDIGWRGLVFVVGFTGLSFLWMATAAYFLLA